MLNRTFLLKKALPVFLGALAGYAYYFFIGCNSGACPLTSNPFVSTIYGALIGLVWALPSSKKVKPAENDNTTN
jgi:hypothetical protein